MCGKHSWHCSGMRGQIAVAAGLLVRLTIRLCQEAVTEAYLPAAVQVSSCAPGSTLQMRLRRKACLRGQAAALPYLPAYLRSSGAPAYEASALPEAGWECSAPVGSRRACLPAFEDSISLKARLRLYTEPSTKLVSAPCSSCGSLSVEYRLLRAVRHIEHEHALCTCSAW